jgi:hypothetical protein
MPRQITWPNSLNYFTWGNCFSLKQETKQNQVVQDNAKSNMQSISMQNRQELEATKETRTTTDLASNYNIVNWEPDDPDDPLNWSSKRKLLAMALVASMAMVG